MAEFESLFFSTWDDFPWNGPYAVIIMVLPSAFVSCWGILVTFTNYLPPFLPVLSSQTCCNPNLHPLCNVCRPSSFAYFTPMHLPPNQPLHYSWWHGRTVEVSFDSAQFPKVSSNYGCTHQLGLLSSVSYAVVVFESVFLISIVI